MKCVSQLFSLPDPTWPWWVGQAVPEWASDKELHPLTWAPRQICQIPEEREGVSRGQRPGHLAAKITLHLVQMSVSAGPGRCPRTLTAAHTDTLPG